MEPVTWCLIGVGGIWVLIVLQWVFGLLGEIVDGIGAGMEFLCRPLDSHPRYRLWAQGMETMWWGLKRSAQASVRGCLLGLLHAVWWPLGLLSMGLYRVMLPERSGRRG